MHSAGRSYVITLCYAVNVAFVDVDFILLVFVVLVIDSNFIDLILFNQG